jgi:hypothetical protein
MRVDLHLGIALLESARGLPIDKLLIYKKIAMPDP